MRHFNRQWHNIMQYVESKPKKNFNKNKFIEIKMLNKPHQFGKIKGSKIVWKSALEFK